MANTVDLRSLFLSLQNVMTAELHAGRDNLNHPVSKGDASEANWKNALERFLPQRYRVERATVVDSTGRASDCIDLVIFDRQYSPLLFELHNQLYVPAESVYAVLEVKQELSAGFLSYAGDKAESVRKLKRKVKQAAGMTQSKQPVKIIAGIVASSSSWHPPLGNAFKNALFALTGARQLDIGCAIEHGAFDVTSRSGKRFAQSRPDATLIFFLVRLLTRLQNLGTVPAIDLEAYSKNSAVQV